MCPCYSTWNSSSPYVVVELTSVSFVSLLFPGDLFSLFSEVVAAVVLLEVTLLQENILFVSVQLILGMCYEQIPQKRKTRPVHVSSWPDSTLPIT